MTFLNASVISPNLLLVKTSGYTLSAGFWDHFSPKVFPQLTMGRGILMRFSRYLCDANSLSRSSILLRGHSDLFYCVSFIKSIILCSQLPIDIVIVVLSPCGADRTTEPWNLTQSLDLDLGVSNVV